MIVDEQISKYKAIELIYDTYHIVKNGESVAAIYFNVEGIERLVNDNKIPREIASIIYKIMLEGGIRQ